MKAEGWRLVVLNAVREADSGNKETLDLLSKYLEECDLAKQALRDKGFGWTGLGILETVSQIEEDGCRCKI